MSRMATAEYIGAKRRIYSEADRRKRVRILDEVCETTGYSRKHANRLLTGNRKFRERKGRGKTYTADVAEILKKVWLEAGCPCAPYFKIEIGRWVEEDSTEVAVIPPGIRQALLRMSDRTMSRLLAGETRVKPGWSKGNKRSGRRPDNEIKRLVPCASGETKMGCDVPPGDVQVDTFALGGGDPSGNFYWILTAADRKLQWIALAPAWNRGRAATCDALAHIRKRFPFAVQALHCDNGGEILNHHVLAWIGQSPHAPFIWRSRPRKCNDNAHVEEKNGSAGRQLFGEMRLDCPGLQAELEKLCDDGSDYRNFFCPCKMLVAKEKRPDGKGFRCRYDIPRTPFQRLLDEGILSPETEKALRKRRDRCSGMELYRRVRKRLRKILRLQRKYAATRKTSSRTGPACPPLPLRGTPSGTAVLRRSRTAPPSHPAQERAASVQYLANQKPPDFLQGVLSI